jgi:hypothetical protein
MTEDNSQLSAQDEVDLTILNAANEPLDTTVIGIWEKVLGDIEVMRETRITPGYANKQLQRWPRMLPEELPVYYRLFHDYLLPYRAVVEEQIRLHPDAKGHLGPVGEETSDAVANRAIYKEILLQWNLVTIRHEEQWQADGDFPYAHLAAIHEAQLFVTGPQGIQQLLGQAAVGFQWTDEDQAALVESVNEAAGVSGE